MAIRDCLQTVADSHRPPEFQVSNQDEERDINRQIVKNPWIPVFGPMLKKIYNDKD